MPSWNIINGVLNFISNLRSPSGTTASPSYAFSSEPSSGWYRKAAGNIALSVLGVDRINADPTSSFVRGPDGGAYFIVTGGGSGVAVNSCPFVFSNGGTPKFIFGQVGATDAQVTITNGSATTGVGLDVSTDALLKIRTRAQTGDASVSALLLQVMTAIVAAGGGAAPTFTTIGGTGPATAAQNGWLKFTDSTGAACFVPVWK